MSTSPKIAELISKLTCRDVSDPDPLLNLISLALLDGGISMEDICDALESTEDIEVNALDVIPLLWSNYQVEKSYNRLLYLSVKLSSAKESIIALQEAFETLNSNLNSYDDNEHEDLSTALTLCEQFRLLLELFAIALSKLTLRKKGPLETIKPIFANISFSLEKIGALADQVHGRNALYALSYLVLKVSTWLKSSTKTKEEKEGCNALLTKVLLTATAIFARQIQSSRAETYLENNFPRRYLHSSIPPDSQRGREVAEAAITAAKSLDLSPKLLLKLLSVDSDSKVHSLGGLVLLGHFSQDQFPPKLQDLISMSPSILQGLRANIASDECMFLLLSRANTIGTLDPETLFPIIHALVPISAQHPDPPQRNLAFLTISLLLKRLPSTPRLACLSELVSPECIFPPMRVAAIGLLKESILASLAEPKKDDIFASPQVFTAIGRYVLRPEPPELFSSRPSLETFLDSIEPSRLVECLGLYYTVLLIDQKNMTGLRSKTSVTETKRALLDPLEEAIELWRDGLTVQPGEYEALMPLVALEMAIARIRETVENFN